MGHRDPADLTLRTDRPEPDSSPGRLSDDHCPPLGRGHRHADLERRWRRPSRPGHQSRHLHHGCPCRTHCQHRTPRRFRSDRQPRPVHRKVLRTTNRRLCGAELQRPRHQRHMDGTDGHRRWPIGRVRRLPRLRRPDLDTWPSPDEPVRGQRPTRHPRRGRLRTQHCRCGLCPGIG